MLRPYLHRDRFTVRTDQHALRWLLNLTDVSRRLARWRLRLAEYEFEVKYRPGIKHQLADGMSHLRTSADPEEIEDEMPCFSIDDMSGDGDCAKPLRIVPRTTLFKEHPECPTGFFDTPGDPSTDAGVPILEMEEAEPELMPITAEEFLREQASDPFCKEKPDTIGDAKSQFEYDRY